MEIRNRWELIVDPVPMGNREPMSRSSVVLSAVTNQPTSTSDLYERVGYLALAQVGLIPYAAFRAELARLSAEGLVDSEIGDDGSTRWRLAAAAPEQANGSD
jgi:hypothetical protein